MTIQNHEAHSSEAYLNQVLSQWAEAVNNFNLNYRRLSLLIQSFQENPQKPSFYLGHYSLKDLKLLLSLMHKELERLQDEMLQNDEVNKLSNQGYAKLIQSHVSRLNDSNKLVEMALVLTDKKVS